MIKSFPVIIILLFNFSFLNAQIIRITGASTMLHAADHLTESYGKKVNQRFVLAAGGSGRGISDTVNGISDIGMVSRALTSTEKNLLDYVTIGYDALAIIVNINNPLNSITKSQIIDIYTGKITNWDAVTDFDSKISLVSKEVGRSTLDLFEEYSGLKSPQRNGVSSTLISNRAFVIGSNAEAMTITGGLPGGIAYVSLGDAEKMISMGMPVKILTLDGVTAESVNILNGRYPVIRELNFVFDRSKYLAVKPFLEYSLSHEGQAIVEKMGFLRSRK
jgi:phosphate transport system substrate-binding protein